MNKLASTCVVCHGRIAQGEVYVRGNAAWGVAEGDTHVDCAPRAWYWLSFVDPDRLEGERFLGVAIARARSSALLTWGEFTAMRIAAGHPDPEMPDGEALFFTEAVQEAWRLGVNPGGEVEGFPIPPQHLPGTELRQRLLTEPGELQQAGAAAR